MKKTLATLKDAVITIGVICACSFLCQVIQNKFENNSLIPSIFILGAFLTSVLTEGYIYGIACALISVIAVNFAFAYPYFRFDFTIPENLVSAIILLVVAVVTSALTTKLKRQEMIKSESEKERMRANLLRAVSHDLRTPLTTIYGASSALLENYNDFSDEQRNQMLTGIKEDSQWLGRMVENLLSVTRLDGDNVKVIKTETVLDELIDSVLIKFANRYPSQEVEVNIPDEFIVIPMDAILIEQVAINLLENAVQHANGMTKLSLNVYTASDKAVFEIKDNGCGIDKDRLKNIFVGHYSSETPTDGKKNNAGIGLSVCASIIKAHGGEIYAENLKSGGACFRFALRMEGLCDE